MAAEKCERTLTIYHHAGLSTGERSTMGRHNPALFEFALELLLAVMP